MGKLNPGPSSEIPDEDWQEWKRDSRRLLLLQQVVWNSNQFKDLYSPGHPSYEVCQQVAQLGELMKEVNLAIPDHLTAPRMITGRRVWDRFTELVGRSRG